MTQDDVDSVIPPKILGTSSVSQMDASSGLIDDHRHSQRSVTNGSTPVEGQRAIAPVINTRSEARDSPSMKLEIEDGSSYLGTSFGSDKSIAGELVFQTGMVGYPESITDPSYRGQILIITFPLVGNYGVPSRDSIDESLGSLPAHFEASRIHIAGLVVATYSGEDYSHYLATSSLGKWLKEEGVPAMYGVDTRALTKKIREKGSMLGKLLTESSLAKNHVNGTYHTNAAQGRKPAFDQIDWFDPNTRNLVADGENTALSLSMAQI